VTPVDQAAIRQFVRKTLGCKCPESVFRDIDLGHGRVTGGAPPHTRLLIGDRLLIHILEPTPGVAMAAPIAALARQGCKEREANGYNRYRLVIVSADVPGTTAEATKPFAKAIGEHDRAHLHVLATNQLPDALRLP
jgi:hypothetical protein